MKAVNIKWDTDGDRQLAKELPSEIEIPDSLIEDMEDFDSVSYTHLDVYKRQV